MYVWRNVEARSCNHCCNVKAITITCSECVSLSVCVCVCVCVCRLRYSACNARAPYYRPWSVRIYKMFPHCLINSTIFGEKVTKHKMCVLIFSTVLSETFLILRRIPLDIIITYTILHVKCPLFLSYVNETWIFDRILKSTQKSNFINFLPVWTDRHGGTHMA